MKTTVRDGLTLMRPWHACKNLLIFLPLFFHGGIFSAPEKMAAAAIGFAAFSLSASAIYALNDCRDAPQDRQHPRKKNRPVAAGRISERAALTMALALAVLSAGILLAGHGMIAQFGAAAATLAAYLLMNVCYTVFGLKHVPILDVSIVALGFVMRILFGSFLTGIPVSSWLLLTGTWLETAGGPLNLVVAFALCIIIELPFAFAYMEAIPMLPLPGGEVVYSYAAFGSRGGFAVGWAGILMNTIVFCWVDLAAVSLLDELFPALGRTAVLYELGDFPVTLPNVAIQLALAGAILWVQLRGANVCASLAKLATVVLLIMCAVGLAVCFTHFDPAVYASDGGLDFDFAGSASLLSLLVFSVAGWETVSKAAADASGPAARKAGAALITCLFLVTGILCLVSTAVAGCMPWREAVGRTAPFADVLVSITGVPAVRVLFLATAFVGAVGVMNSTLYSSAQMLYGLSRFALVSRAFSALHPKYGTPARCIWFTAAFVVLTPFTGRLFFLPFINIASLATIVMWIMSLAAVLRLRRARPDLRRPVRMPGGRVTAVLGVAASVFLAGNILLPFSPGALDGREYALAAALAALGVLLYGFRDRTLSDEAREALIFGGPERR